MHRKVPGNESHSYLIIPRCVVKSLFAFTFMSVGFWWMTKPFNTKYKFIRNNGDILILSCLFAIA